MDIQKRMTIWEWIYKEDDNLGVDIQEDADLRVIVSIIGVHNGTDSEQSWGCPLRLTSTIFVLAVFPIF